MYLEDTINIIHYNNQHELGNYSVSKEKQTASINCT